MIKICCISDTHGMHNQVNMPSGDLLIFAGDLTNHGEIDQIRSFNKWLGTLDFEEKIIIPGNHDTSIYSSTFAKDIIKNGTLLIDSYISFREYKIYGSPWSPKFGNWAYQLYRGNDIKKKWDLIPLDTDILVTHGPPLGILDKVPRSLKLQGCRELLNRVKQIQPAIHVFGHLHLNYNKIFKFGIKTLFVNASTCTEEYEPINPPIVFDIKEKHQGVDPILKRSP
jgi:Icc-related predicted phosphoesterase